MNPWRTTVDTAVVLAAGEGRRLRPLTAHRPKPMLSAGTRPIIEHVLDALADAGVSELHLVVGYGRDRIQSHVGPTYRDRSVTYHRQAKRLGSGHALLQAAGALDDDCLVVNGDQLVSTELVRAVVDGHGPADVATIAVVENDAAPDYGAVRLDGDRVTELVEQPGDDGYRLLNAGVYAVSPEFADAVDRTPRQTGELSLTRTIARLAETERSIRGVHTEGVWQDAAYPWDLLALSRTVLDGGNAAGDATADDDRVSVATGASVHEAATLVAPVAVASDCVVGPGAVLGPNTALGPNATVAAGTVVRNAVVETDAWIGENATVIDGVVGPGAVLEPGVSLPGGDADVRVGTTVHEDCRLGGVVADRARIGGGSTVAPGTLVGPDARAAPGTVVRGRIEADERVSN